MSYTLGPNGEAELLYRAPVFLVPRIEDTIQQAFAEGFEEGVDEALGMYDFDIVASYGDGYEEGYAAAMVKRFPGKA